jgi:hypothetical protein
MNRRYLLDLLERVLSTAAFAALAVLLPTLTDGDLPGSTEGKVALIAALAASGSLVKGLLATRIGSPHTAALLPVKDDTPAPARP